MFVLFFFFIPQLDNYEIKPNKSLKVNISVPNLRLFVGNIPKSKGKDEILEEFNKSTGKWTFKFVKVDCQEGRIREFRLLYLLGLGIMAAVS